MKKIYVVLISALLFCTASAQWRVAVEQTKNDVSDIFMYDENIGWEVGYYGRVYKTTNGGVTWDVKYEHLATDNFYFSSVYFVNSNIGYAAGYEGTVIKTTDGGENWSVLSVTGTTNNLKDIFFTDENTGYTISAVSNSSKIHKTTDGGATWQEILDNTTSDLESINFYDANKGVSCGGGVGVVDILYTTDGGANWTKAPVPPLGGFQYTRSDMKSVDFADANTVYITGWGSTVGLQPSVHLKSTDGGASWTFLTQLENNRTYCNLVSIKMRDVNNGFAVGGYAYFGSVIVRTTDGGQNWIPLNAPFGGSCRSVYSIGDKVWISINGGGTIYSPDYGNTWQLLTPMPGNYLYTVETVGNSIYSAGYDGQFIRSTDMGYSWSASYIYNTRSCPAVNELAFPTELIGYAARNSGGLNKTTDGGLTWTQLMTDTFATGPTNESVFFLNENEGYVAGRVANNSDVIYKTTDGGATWTSKTNQFFKDLYNIKFFSNTSGAVAGKDLTAGFTTDAGVTWTPSTLEGDLTGLASNDFKDIAFDNSSSSGNGILVGQKMLFTTANGGATWTYQPNPLIVKDANGAALNGSHGFVVGDSLFMETTDGGQTWTSVYDSAEYKRTNFYSVSFDDDGYAWVTTTLSRVYTNSPLVSVDGGFTAVNQFEMAQNYPNPFNPSTNIEFKLSKSSHVMLKVYDMLGREIALLVDEFREAGNHIVKFNSKGLSTGVYIYKLTAEGNSITKKMTLLK